MMSSFELGDVVGISRLSYYSFVRERLHDLGHLFLVWATASVKNWRNKRNSSSTS